MTFSRIAAVLTATVVVHAVVVLLHARAHQTLTINMSGLQNAFIGLVIIAAPIVAAVLVWTSYRRIGALILAVSMLGALIFGGYHHFLDPGIDNISSVAPHDWGTVFRLTAFLLAIIEAWGSVAGWWGFRLILRAQDQA